MTPYFVFARDHRAEYARRFPHLRAPEVTAALAAAWRDLTQAQRARYQRIADLDHDRFTRERAAMRERAPAPPSPGAVENNSESEYEDAPAEGDDPADVDVLPAPAPRRRLPTPPVGALALALGTLAGSPNTLSSHAHAGIMNMHMGSDGHGFGGGLLDTRGTTSPTLSLTPTGPDRPGQLSFVNRAGRIPSQTSSSSHGPVPISAADATRDATSAPGCVSGAPSAAVPLAYGVAGGSLLGFGTPTLPSSSSGPTAVPAGSAPLSPSPLDPRLGPASGGAGALRPGTAARGPAADASPSMWADSARGSAAARAPSGSVTAGVGTRGGGERLDSIMISLSQMAATTAPPGDDAAAAAAAFGSGIRRTTFAHGCALPSHTAVLPPVGGASVALGGTSGPLNRTSSLRMFSFSASATDGMYGDN